MALCKPTPNTIINGDCALVMAEWEPEIIDLTVTSPPYDNLRDYEGYHFDFEPIARQLYRVTKNGGVVVWIVADETRDGTETGNSFYQALFFFSIGFNLYDTMIWDKGRLTTPTHERYYDAFDYMFILSKGKPKALNLICDHKNKVFGEKKQRHTRIGREGRGIKGHRITGKYSRRFNIWRIVSNQHSTDTSHHPATFPEVLARDHILSWSNPGDLVLDPMCGSGTTLKMAKQTGRDYIGIDVSPNYCQLSEKRVRGAQSPLFQETGNLTKHALDGSTDTVKEAEIQPELIPAKLDGSHHRK